ncbi:hypothetical protein TVAG_296050 [Trichomonas vaginalis G3]|uniref:Uncharacterized protein n=1 Tax=Trichomonas vaginalis (strain ATCC PRA-98 / G3) TaxID=412133 RepID=A2FW80_TRIV3|nr:hypothetical protein TVAGG3_0347120 [Trichomonas vaginalis G3]EAX90835.1 hypothetical protein TVAG_296050 [Trichomonas vaginalis G3]KAI5531037.1 hypothetical protein TVAGG3_0347120 [Trichomonas vaginalis G3]|eukprot:XP_001303765.1 hypothetical protein [Trichomonas vaginalis G3]
MLLSETKGDTSSLDAAPHEYDAVTENFGSVYSRRSPNYKTSASKGGKRLPDYAFEKSEMATDIEYLRKQQSLKNEKRDELENGGHGKRARSSAKCPPEYIEPKVQSPPRDIRKIPDSEIQNKSLLKKPEPKSVPTTPMLDSINTSSRPKPIVQFNVAPQAARDVFRPPTPIPFMPRVNSLPYVGAPDDPFDLPNVEDNYNLQTSIGEDAFDLSYSNTPIVSRSNSISQKSIPLDSEYLPPLELNYPQYPRVESPLSPRSSPSIRERTPIDELFPIRNKAPVYKRTWFIVIMILALLLLILFFL